MSLKVIGAGYGRTGTKSLQLALEKLGFDNCYHMEALFRNSSDVKHWKNAYEEKPTDWGTLFSNYNSAVDFPTSMYYKELADYFPDSKIVLTTRDPEKWYNSAFSTIYSFDPGIGVKLKMLLSLPFSSTARNLFKVILLNEKSLWKKYFEGKFEDKEYAIGKFNQHIVDVKREIPENRLLLFHPRDGWAPLCEFLNVPVPDEPFPNANKGEDFASWAKGIIKEVLS
ncbi:MAG: sulfotransferase family protein [Gilvibacter sp.]